MAQVVQAGQERVTDGLWTHRGKFVVTGVVVLPAAVFEAIEGRLDALEQRVGELEAKTP